EMRKPRHAHDVLDHGGEARIHARDQRRVDLGYLGRLIAVEGRVFRVLDLAERHETDLRKVALLELGYRHLRRVADGDTLHVRGKPFDRQAVDDAAADKVLRRATD